MASIAQQVAELLDLQRDILADAPPGQKPPLQHELRYYARKRALVQRLVAGPGHALADVARQLDDLLDAERAMLAGRPPVQEPLLTDQVTYYTRKRALMQCIADETGETDARQSAVEADETLALLHRRVQRQG